MISRENSALVTQQMHFIDQKKASAAYALASTKTNINKKMICGPKTDFIKRNAFAAYALASKTKKNHKR